MEALVLERKGELSIREIALPTEVAVLKPKWNEQGPRRYQPGGYYRSFANYRPPSFEVDAKNFAAIRSGDPVISRFWDCQKKSFRVWRILKRRRFSRSLKKDLKGGLKKTSYAISVDETRYVHPIGYLAKAQWSPHKTS